MVGFCVAVLNLLILGSMVKENIFADAPHPAIWLPGTILATCLIAALASQIANRKSKIETPNWTFRFSLVALAATLLLLIAGGLVTGREAGLAVPDWPRSYGYNMFFYPLTKMRGNIFFEHAHRLLGVLVGLTTVALAIHLWATERRRWMWVVAAVAVLAVAGQGVMGGFRVTEAVNPQGIEVATAAHETAASETLRVAHGIAAQLFFAFLACVAAMVSGAWQTARPVKLPGARGLCIVTLTLLLTQLLLGAWLRHRSDATLILHIAAAALILFIGLGAGIRATEAGKGSGLRRLGFGLLTLIVLQPLLGVVALLVRSPRGQTPAGIDVAFTTAHQLTGAILLASGAALTVLVCRVTRGEDTGGQAASGTPRHEEAR